MGYITLQDLQVFYIDCTAAFVYVMYCEIIQLKYISRLIKYYVGLGHTLSCTCSGQNSLILSCYHFVHYRYFIDEASNVSKGGNMIIYFCLTKIETKASA